MGLDPDGKDVEQGEHLPSQENHRNDRYRDRQHLAEIQIAAAWLEAPCDQAKNIQSCEPKHQHPQDVIDIIFLAGMLIGKLEQEEQHRLQADETRPRPTT